MIRKIGKFFTYLLLSPKEKETVESKLYRDTYTMATLIFADIKCGFVKNGSHKDT